MELTTERKNYIDNLEVYDLLHKVRFSKSGDDWMQGETGKYWMSRLAKIRDSDNDAYVRASKEMGWSR
jgi:hypothetical protein